MSISHKKESHLQFFHLHSLWRYSYIMDISFLFLTCLYHKTIVLFYIVNPVDRYRIEK